MKIVKEYEEICAKVANEFNIKYFPEEAEVYAAGDDATGIWFFSDYFFRVDHMYQYMKYGYTLEQMLDREEKLLDALFIQETIPNIKNWIKLCLI